MTRGDPASGGRRRPPRRGGGRAGRSSSPDPYADQRTDRTEPTERLDAGYYRQPPPRQPHPRARQGPVGDPGFTERYAAGRYGGRGNAAPDHGGDGHGRFVPPPGPDLGPGPRKITVTRVAALRTRYLSKLLVRKIGAASRAQGAGETGLNKLIWLNAVNMAADMMIAVCLAGTIFFSAATSQQRANVALYLLITMAPFALVAPVVGPVLDRLHRGRRWALGGTLLGRALLAYVMAANFHSIALYPAAFGALVLAKSYSVLRGAAVPRVMPAQLTLVTANARMSIFGLGAATVAALLTGGFIKLTGSYPWALRITAAVFVVGAVMAVRLPRHVDSPDTGAAPEPLKAGFWRSRGVLGARVVLALRATSAVRGLSGFLTLFMAFLIQSRLHGTAAAVELGAIVAAAAGGSLLGTAAGAKLPLARPDLVVLASIGTSAGACVLAAVAYSIETAVLVALVVGAANSLAKLALDAIIQREVPERLAASAFAQSETVLQLAWVFGGGLGIALPSNGRVGFSVAALLLVAAFAVTMMQRRRAGIVAP
ncbi:MAG TPA: MFS transporter [Mycobacteriales bacterium]|nr:MFS transporter [Mycobacteriales bacterium]